MLAIILLPFFFFNLLSVNVIYREILVNLCVPKLVVVKLVIAICVHCILHFPSSYMLSQYFFNIKSPINLFFHLFLFYFTIMSNRSILIETFLMYLKY